MPYFAIRSASSGLRFELGSLLLAVDGISCSPMQNQLSSSVLCSAHSRAARSSTRAEPPSSIERRPEFPPATFWTRERIFSSIEAAPLQSHLLRRPSHQSAVSVDASSRISAASNSFGSTVNVRATPPCADDGGKWIRVNVRRYAVKEIPSTSSSSVSTI